MQRLVCDTLHTKGKCSLCSALCARVGAIQRSAPVCLRRDSVSSKLPGPGHLCMRKAQILDCVVQNQTPGNPTGGSGMEKGTDPTEQKLRLTPSEEGQPRKRDPDTGCWPGPRTQTPAAHKVLVAMLAAVITCLTLALVTVIVTLAGGKCTACLAAVACPEGWVGYGGKCYYFSALEGNWSTSQSNCSALGASLAGIDTLQEQAFLIRYKGPSDHWIGLRREQDQPWKWANGTEFNNWFELRGGGDCAYLNEEAAVSFSRCYTRRNWICSKEHGTLKKN